MRRVLAVTGNLELRPPRYAIKKQNVECGKTRAFQGLSAIA
jgi:hypothetical protein